MSLGLSSKSVGFKPQVYMKEDEKNGTDPVLKEGNLLTNVFNRLICLCFYTLQNLNENIPKEEISIILNSLNLRLISLKKWNINFYKQR